MLEFLYTLLKDIGSAIRRGAQSVLSREERDILAASDERGDMFLLQVSTFGHWVRSGSTDFFNQNDLAYNARYQDALDSLVTRGLARHVGGHLFRLTGRGFDFAKQIKKKRNVEQCDRG